MFEQELPRVGDLVTIPANPGDHTTRTGRVRELTESGKERGRWLLALESITMPGVEWTEWWAPRTMIVTPRYSTEPLPPIGCGHEITGGYVYTGEPTASRSMELECVALHDIDDERLWFRGWDEERMEVEVTIKGLTLPVIDRLTDRPAPAREAMGALRGCMAQYLDSRALVDGMHYEPRMRSMWDKGAGDMLAHLVMLTLGKSAQDATEWLAEELQEMLANRG
jgi:hypothetical protein